MVTRRGYVPACFLLSFAMNACAQERQPTLGDSPPQKPSAQAAATGEHRPHAGMLRFPDVSGTHVVFVYGNDLWLVPREGGLATPLASPPGQEAFPRFSPDGQSIAFVGNYEGNKDIYSMPIAGGVPRRVTYHPSAETLCDWNADGRLIYFAPGVIGLARQSRLLTTSPSGGLPTELPVPYGTNGAISADGQWLAYTPHSHDHRTWKRYRGGMATDIWLFNLKDKSAKKITDWEGTDSQPMWLGNKLYYMSDEGPEHRLNIWSYDPATGRRAQVTKFADYDVKWPSIGPGSDGSGEIVLQLGPTLQLLSLATGASKTVEIAIPGDRPTIRPYDYEPQKFINAWEVSATGKRAVLEARGDIWTVPNKQGSPLNLTHTSGVAERDPAWSADGQWIAYFSDATGEYELYVAQSDGRGETRQLTSSNAKIFLGAAAWSPDSKQIAFSDQFGTLYVHTLESKQTKAIDKNPWGGQVRVSWAPDSRWLTYVKGTDNQGMTAIWLYDLPTDKKTQVTSGMFSDSWPTFDRKGDYLFFASNRAFNSPMYEDVGTTFIYADTDVLFAVPLRAKVGSPWAPKSDDEKWGEQKDAEKKEDKEKKEGEKKDGETKDEKPAEKSDQDAKAEEKKDEEKKDEEKKDGEKKKEEVKPIEIELDGFERRAIPLPVDKGNFSLLAVNDKHQLLYVRGAARGSSAKTSVKLFDLTDEEKKEKTVLEEVGQFVVSADGKKILVRKDATMAIVDAAADQKLDKPLNLAAMRAKVDPREEWRQMFVEAWRVERDYFYDPNMHGLDWLGVRKQYERMLTDCASRDDLDFIIGEMISELNVGHAYVGRGGGDRESEPSVNVGMLGADFTLENGAYRIATIHEGGAWDYDARGPLSQPGVDVKAGDYLLAVNGNTLDPLKDPWAAFQGLGGKTVTITVSDKPTLDDSARHLLVQLKDGEDDLRFRAWIERNRKYVEDQTEGKVGYIYVPNTGVQGQNELFRQFYGQKDKLALIIDERWNGGGQIPTRFIELLHRPKVNYWATRADRDWSWPPDAHGGPKCMLVNGLAGSGGDCFPYYFKQRKLGKVIGTRTWGGLVGISGNPQLIDSGGITAPTFAFYETDGTWGVEGHGVDPDVEILADPSKMTDGGDPQLDAAIANMLDEIRKNPYAPPKRPAYPDRRGMGIKEQDK
ncbi:MAG: PDZ domain-containing protein [Planctomycetota bacterium]